MDETRIEDLVNETEADALAMVREVVLRAHPDAVPELIAGATIGELLASVVPARAAYARVRETVAGGSAVPPAVPAGAAVSGLDLGSVPSMELIRRGVARARR